MRLHKQTLGSGTGSSLKKKTGTSTGMGDEHFRQDDFFCATTTGWDTCLFKHIEKNYPHYFVCTNALFEKIILYPHIGWPKTFNSFEKLDRIFFVGFRL